MSEKDPSPGREPRALVSRRQLLGWVPGLAALAAAGSGQVSASTSVPSALPVSALAAVSADDALDMPFRTREEAIVDCTRRRYWEDRRANQVPGPLEKILGIAPLTGSRLALANWPQLDETEDLNLGSFSFPISPFNITADDGIQQFLLFSNSQIISNFRHREYLEVVHRRIFDRAVWALDQGRNATAVVEFDRPVTDQKVDRIVKLLTYYGVRTIIWGNELNDPSAPWRDNLPALFDIYTTAARVLREMKANDVELCLPGLAYYGFGEYLQKMLRSFKDLQRGKFPKTPDDLPVQRIADHYYGAVEDLLPRIQIIRGILSSEGLSRLKYDLTEVGNPTLPPGQPRATDDQLADSFIPQIACLAVGSGMVERVTYYSLLDASDYYSFVRVDDDHLSLKPGYRAFVTMAKLLSGLKRASVVDDKQRVVFEGARSDGVEFQVVWSKVQDRELWTDLPERGRLFDVMGRETAAERPGQFALRPKQHPALAGPARIVITKTSR
ncbi:MAG TPA: hypothetical protein VF960_08985 [Chloroflexota bacterium]